MLKHKQNSTFRNYKNKSLLVFPMSKFYYYCQLYRDETPFPLRYINACCNFELKLTNEGFK